MNCGTADPEDDNVHKPLNDMSSVDNWDDAWVSRSTQELRLQLAARRARDPKLTDFENDLLDDAEKNVIEAKPAQNAVDITWPNERTIKFEHGNVAHMASISNSEPLR